MQIIHSRFQEALPRLPHFKMIFADPPDNIGLGYASQTDRLPANEYRQLLSDTLYVSCQHCDILWVSFNAVHLPLFGALTHQFLADTGWSFKPCVQAFTFGQHNHRDFGNNHRPLWRFSRPEATFYPDAVRVPSWRQLNGDRRADPRGRVPGDCFDFPRVVGNSQQRRAWHPTQLNEELYRRCVKFSCKTGDAACDIYAGTGTLARVCSSLGILCTLIDTEKTYCEKLALEHNLQCCYTAKTLEWSETMTRPKDYRGREIYEGACLAYPVRKGSSMWMQELRVCRIIEEPYKNGTRPIIIGANKNGRRVRFTRPERSVLLGHACTPIGD